MITRYVGFTNAVMWTLMTILTALSPEMFDAFAVTMLVAWLMAAYVKRMAHYIVGIVVTIAALYLQTVFGVSTVGQVKETVVFLTIVSLFVTPVLGSTIYGVRLVVRKLIKYVVDTKR